MNVRGQRFLTQCPWYYFWLWFVFTFNILHHILHSGFKKCGNISYSFSFFFFFYIYKVKEQGSKYLLSYFRSVFNIIMSYVSRLNFVIFQGFLRIYLFLETVSIKAREYLESKQKFSVIHLLCCSDKNECQVDPEFSFKNYLHFKNNFSLGEIK